MSEPPSTLPFRLADLLGSGVTASECKLHAARRNTDGDDPLAIYVQSWDRWVGWNRWRSDRDDFKRPLIFALMQLEPRSDEWIFGGVFRVTGRRDIPQAPSYDVELVRDFTESLIGRLHVRFRAPARGRAFYFERFLPQMEVIGIAEQAWTGARFPGIDSINHSFRDLEAVVHAQREDWLRVLDNLKGVYVWNDRKTGKGYIGSATSETGALWSRLCNYIESGHAGNRRLLDLVGEHGREYLRENFSYALLEYWPTRVDDAHVLARESYWKDVFGTRTHGYNAN